MPRRRDIDHYLLHFRLERDEDSASDNIKRRSGIIVAAFETASVDTKTPLEFLIARMNVIIGKDKIHADAIRDFSVELKGIDADNRPVELLTFLARS